MSFLKFIYSEKATKFYEIFPLLLTAVHTVKCKGKISQHFVSFSEYMNFNIQFHSEPFQPGDRYPEVSEHGAYLWFALLSHARET